MSIEQRVLYVRIAARDVDVANQLAVTSTGVVATRLMSLGATHNVALSRYGERVVVSDLTGDVLMLDDYGGS